MTKWTELDLLSQILVAIIVSASCSLVATVYYTKVEQARAEVRDAAITMQLTEVAKLAGPIGEMTSGIHQLMREIDQSQARMEAIGENQIRIDEHLLHANSEHLDMRKRWERTNDRITALHDGG